MTAHPSTVPMTPSTNPLFAMLGGVIVGTVVPNGGLQMTVTIGDRGTRVEYDQGYLLIPAGAAMLIKPDGSGIVIDPSAKTYWKVAKMELGMMGASSKPDVKITATGESATLTGVRANRSTLAIRLPLPGPTEGGLPGMPPELSISGDIWLAPEYTRYAKIMPSMANVLFAAIGMDAISADGFPMRVVIRGDMFAGQEIEAVVTSISELTVPAILFDVPADYREVPQPPLPGIGAGR